MTSSTAAKKPTRTPVRMNGVDTPNLLATISAVGSQPDLAQFKFRARGRWVTGTQSEVTMHGFYGAGEEHTHIVPYRASADHPAVLCGADAGPTPVEWVLQALASCLISGIGNISAARGVKLDKAEINIEGDMDLRGILGLSDEVRNGFQSIRVAITIDGDASPEKLEQIAMQAKARSAVFDILTKGVPVTVGVKTPASSMAMN